MCPKGIDGGLMEIAEWRLQRWNNVKKSLQISQNEKSVLKDFWKLVLKQCLENPYLRPLTARLTRKST